MAEVDVLVVDAIARQRGKLAFFLRASGYRVDVAGTFEAAREKIARSAPKCVVTAVRLGLYNGLHLIARTRRNRRFDCFCTDAHAADPVLEVEASAFGVASYLVLPCPGDVLVEVVKQSILEVSKSSDLSISQMKVSAGEDSAIVADLSFVAKH